MKRVLIITYYWPPSGSSGVQRWLKFAKYLPEFGWQPVIYTPENPDAPETDATLMKDVAKDLEVIKTPIWEPYQLFKKLTGRKKEEKVNAGTYFDDGKQGLVDKCMLWIRGNLMIPDPRVFWVRPSVKYLRNYLNTHPVDAIVTTGPPQSMHLIGLGLKKAFPALPWLADFRDPWSGVDILDKFFITKRALRKHTRLEQQVFRHANAFTSVSPTWAAEMTANGAKNTQCITNGYDENDFINYRPKSSGRFVISHIGVLNSFRSPQVIWDALASTCKTRPTFGDQLEIRLAGTIDPGIRAYLENHPVLKDKVKFLGYLPHQEAIRQYEESDVLMLLLNKSATVKGNIPGKLFELLATGRIILTLGDTTGDLAGILKTSQSGYMFEYDDTKGVQQAVEELASRTQETGWSVNASGDFTQYARRHLTGRVAELLNDLCISSGNR
ncbi:MAG: glycosyl transferase family 1 [Flavobacteriales bacterium]|nr:glycosyl transferase family 1 [Flavobacteriales bacterium]MCB9446988.1 glycosyl transferase family 1 [Flavobacteriales bacterium]